MRTDIEKRSVDKDLEDVKTMKWSVTEPEQLRQQGAFGTFDLLTMQP